MSKNFHTITDIVATVYCEQKAVFDQIHGDTRPISVRVKAAAGTFEHFRFQTEGQTKQVIDRRCFIATHVYGPDAFETIWLREWRDRFLRPRLLGRWAIMLYYLISPILLVFLKRSSRLTHFARIVLNKISQLLGMV